MISRILLISTLVVFALIAAPLISEFALESAEAVKGKGVPASATNSKLVCGDRLCSEIPPEDTSRADDDFFDDDTSRSGLDFESTGPFYNDNYDNHPVTRTAYQLVSFTPMLAVLPSESESSGCYSKFVGEPGNEALVPKNRWYGSPDDPTCLKESEFQLTVYKKAQQIGNTSILQCGVEKSVETSELHAVTEGATKATATDTTSGWDQSTEMSRDMGWENTLAFSQELKIGGQIEVGGEAVLAKATASVEATAGFGQEYKQSGSQSASSASSQFAETTLSSSSEYSLETSKETSKTITTTLQVKDDEQLKWTPFQNIIYVKNDVWKAGIKNVSDYQLTGQKYPDAKTMALTDTGAGLFTHPGGSFYWNGENYGNSWGGSPAAIEHSTWGFDNNGPLGAVSPQSYNFPIGGWIDLQTNHPWPNPFPGHLTVALWVNPRSDNSQAFHPFITKWEHQAGFQSWNIGLYPGDGGNYKLHGNVATTGTSIEGTGLTGGEIKHSVWSHVAMVYDGASVKLYVNGMKVAQAAATGAIKAPTTSPLPIHLAQTHMGSDTYSGWMDQIFVFDQALSQSEVRTLNSPGTLDRGAWWYSGGPPKFSCTEAIIDTKAAQYGWGNSIDGSALPGGAWYKKYDTNAFVHCHPDTGPHATFGGIGTQWHNSNFEHGPMGFPTTDELPIPKLPGAGSVTRVGNEVFQNYQNGVICWDPSKFIVGGHGPEDCGTAHTGNIGFAQETVNNLGGVGQAAAVNDDTKRIGNALTSEIWMEDGRYKYVNFDSGVACQMDGVGTWYRPGLWGPEGCGVQNYKTFQSYSDANNPNYQAAIRQKETHQTRYFLQDPKVVDFVISPNNIKHLTRAPVTGEPVETRPSGIGDATYPYIYKFTDGTQYIGAPANYVSQKYYPPLCQGENNCGFELAYDGVGKNVIYGYKSNVQKIPTMEIHEDVITTQFECSQGQRALNLENLAYPTKSSQLKIHLAPAKDNMQIIVTDGNNYAIKGAEVRVNLYTIPLEKSASKCVSKNQVQMADQFGSVKFYVADASKISADDTCDKQAPALDSKISIKATHPHHPSQSAEIVFNKEYTGGGTFGDRWHLATDTPLIPTSIIRIDTIGPQTVTDESLSFTVTADDEEVVKVRKFSLEGAPDGASINPDTGVFAWVPTDAQRGDSYVFDVIVSNGQAEDRERIQIDVSDLVQTEGSVESASLWSGDENSLDSLGAIHGTFEGDKAFAPGVVGNAFSFDGSGDFISLGNPDSLNPTDELTVEAWIYDKGTGSPHRAIIAKYGGGMGDQILLTVSDVNKIRPHVGIVGAGLKYFDGNTIIQPNNWYHVAMTYDGQKLTAYVNGQEDGSIPVTGKMETFNGQMRIGNDNGQNLRFNGLIDEVSFLNKAASAADIKASYDKFGPKIHDVIELSYTTPISGNSYSYQGFTDAENYILQQNDHLEYDLYWKTSDAQIALDFDAGLPNYVGNLRDSGVVDQNGHNAHPATSIPDSLVLNKWYHRSIAIPDHLVGHAITKLNLVGEQNTSDKVFTGYLDNIAITDGKGTLRKLIFDYEVVGTYQPFVSGASMIVKSTPEPVLVQGADTVPPDIIIPNNKVVDAPDNQGTNVDYEIIAIDNVDGVIIPTCSPPSGSFFAIGDKTVVCKVKDSSGNEVSGSFVISVKRPDTGLPSWIKDVGRFWANNEVSDQEFYNAMGYLVQNDIIILPETEEKQAGLVSSASPEYVQTVTGWWAEGQIEDKDFLGGLQYLIDRQIVIIGN